MTHRNTLITHSDQRRLRRLVDQVRSSQGAIVGDFAALRDGLRGAQVVDPEQIPRNVVTMDSQVVLKDLDSGHRLTRTLAYPSEVQRSRNGVSVASPLGTAMLGKRVGQIIRWPRANGDRRLRIQAVLYQPEELRAATFRDTRNGIHGARDDFDHAYKAIRRIARSFQDARSRD